MPILAAQPGPLCTARVHGVLCVWRAKTFESAPAW